MNVAIIDADLVGRKQHRFPNLACMKLSSYHKQIKNNVTLITDYKCLYKDEDIWIDYQEALKKVYKTKK